MQPHITPNFFQNPLERHIYKLKHETPPLTLNSSEFCDGNKYDMRSNSRVLAPKYGLYASHAARLRSFDSWPNSMKQRPTELVEAGFFYTGEGDRVLCHHCGLGLNNWTETAIAWEQHERWFPDCSYVKLIKDKDYIYSPSLYNDVEFKERIINLIHCFVAHVGASIYEFKQFLQQLFFPMQSHKTPDHCKQKQEATFINRSSSDVCDGGDHNMKKEADRLKTFENWPIAFIDPRKLAKEGFYYMKIDDRVKCEFCKVEIARWEEGDNPSVDHQRWAPNCPFLRKLNVGNIPLGVSESSVSTVGSDICGPHITIKPNSICESREASSSYKASVVKPPKHGLFATHSARLKSFASWPTSMKQRPTELVDAGFFYTGEGDRVMCYHCGLGLKDWTDTDIAWEQHARWFPNCSYVQLIKGKDFVSTVLATVNVEDNKTTAKNLEAKPVVNTVIPSKQEANIPSSKPCSSKSPETNYIPDDKLCKICYVEEKNAVYIPCGHVFSCIKCALSVKDCPVCRKPYTDVMRVYIS